MLRDLLRDGHAPECHGKRGKHVPNPCHGLTFPCNLGKRASLISVYIASAHRFAAAPMRRVSEQFYDSDGSDSEGGDSAPSESSPEDKTKENELKVSIILPICPTGTVLMPHQRLQVESAKLKAEIRNLKSMGHAGQDRALSSASSSTLGVVTTNNENKLRHTEYRSLGKRFAILSELWVSPSILKLPRPTNLDTLDPWDPSRCANDQAWNNGIVTELYHFLPGSYHEFIGESATFSKQVRKIFLQTHLPPVPTSPSLVPERSWADTHLSYRQRSEECSKNLPHSFSPGRVLLYKLQPLHDPRVC